MIEPAFERTLIPCPQCGTVAAQEWLELAGGAQVEREFGPNWLGLPAGFGGGGVLRGPRFPGRLGAEWRIRFVRLSPEVRTPASAVHESFRAEAVSWTRPIFAIRAGQYWARIGHGSEVINFGRARFAAQEVSPDKALRQLERR